MKFKRSVSESREMILSGDIYKSIFILSIPTILMAMVQSFIPLIDGYFLNNYGGVLVASSVNFSATIINMLNGLSQGLGAAAMAILGQLNGNGEFRKVKYFAQQIIVFSFLIGILTGPINWALAYILSKNVSPDISTYVYDYLSTYSFVMPLLFLAAIYNSIKNAVGQPEATFIRMIILLILKVIFNFIYLKVLSLKVYGAVLGSFSSYFIIGIWMYYDLFIKESELKLSLKGYKFDFAVIREVVKVGIPTMLSSLFVYLGFFLINMEVQSYGAKVLNASGIASNINTFAFAVPSSISTTVTTMVSMNVGVSNGKRAKSIFYKSLIMSLGLCVVVVLIFVPTAPKLVMLFQRTTGDKQIIDLAIHALNIYTFSVFGFSPYMIAQGAYIGLGRTKIALVVGLLRIWILRYIFIIVFESTMGVDSVFYGNLFSNFAAAAIYLISIRNIEWKSSIKTALKA